MGIQDRALKVIPCRWDAGIPVKNLRICEAAAFLDSLPSKSSPATTAFTHSEVPLDRKWGRLPFSIHQPHPSALVSSSTLTDGGVRPRFRTWPIRGGPAGRSPLVW